DASQQTLPHLNVPAGHLPCATDAFWTLIEDFAPLAASCGSGPPPHPNVIATATSNGLIHRSIRPPAPVWGLVPRSRGVLGARFVAARPQDSGLPPGRGYTWVRARHLKSRRPKVPSEIQKGIPGLEVAGCTGLEPVASGVTGRRYNQLN